MPPPSGAFEDGGGEGYRFMKVKRAVKRVGRMIVPLVCWASQAFCGTLLFEDYETGQRVGSSPVRASEVRPVTPAARLFTRVVDGCENAAGTGKGVRLFDNDSSSGAGCRLEYNIGSHALGQCSAVRVDFSFAALTTAASGDGLKVSVGEYGVRQTSGSVRFMDCRLNADGTVDFASGSGPDRLGNALLSSNNTMSIFINDLDARTVTYTGPDGTTNTRTANSVAYWLNGSRVLNTLLENRTTANGTVFSSSNNIGRISFVSGSADYGLDYVIDDLAVSALSDVTPEPPARLHTLFQDHMMLQRDMDTPVWGRATPGLTVEVLLDDVPAGSAVADAQGDWMVRLAPHVNDGGKSHELAIRVSNEVQQVISDVIFGDVYLCSGQSNMEWKMSRSAGFPEAYADDDYPLIRHVDIARGKWASALDEPYYGQPWTTANPSSIANFTAVGYLFAKEIHARTGVPIGLLHSSYGGQRIKCFLNPAGIERVPELAGFRRHAEEGGVKEVSSIYNGQIAPLVPFGICGILWYQGETDRFDPVQYEEKMVALMRGWRAAWGRDDLPFYYCQLPHCNREGFYLIRDHQLRALSEPGSGMAVLIDVGDDTNIHPANKQDPGFRLAQWALADVYGCNVVCSGPI